VIFDQIQVCDIGRFVDYVDRHFPDDRGAHAVVGCIEKEHDTFDLLQADGFGAGEAH